MIIKDFLFSKCRGVHVEFLIELSIPNSIIKQFNVMRFTRNNDVVWSFLCGDNRIFVIEVGCFVTYVSLKINVALVCIDQIRFLNFDLNQGAHRLYTF